MVELNKQPTNGATSTRKAERREDSAFGKIAIKLEILTKDQLDRCLAEQKERAAEGEYIRLGKLLVARKFISTQDFMKVLDRQNKTILTCPSCAAQYNVRAHPPGKRMRCKHCKEVLTVPTEIETLTVRDTLEGAAYSDSRLEAQSRTFGNYIVLEEIARGGMGIVFRARQQGFDREVALKVLKRDRISSEEHLERFYREARLAGQLTHPNIVAIYEVGECEGEPFFAMAYIKGQSLEGLLRQGALPKHRALELIETIALAMHYAHDLDIVHRDLKPANILIDEDGRPQLTDFGLAKHLEGQSLTQSGIDIGTPHYMSPEQVLGQVERIDKRSDVYSLGVMLYQVMTRRLPFGGKSAIEIYHKILNHTPVRPTSLKRGLPRELDVVCQKAMAREPAHRYQTAAEFAEDVRRLRSGEPITARPPRALVRLFWTARRHRWSCAAGLSILLFALLGAGLAIHRAPRKPEKTPVAQTPPAQQPAPNKPPAKRRQQTKAERAELSILKAETAMSQEQFDRARSHLAQALKLTPRNFKVHFLIGRIHQLNRKPKLATASLRKCLNYNPAFWEAIRYLGFSLYGQSRTKEALETFNRLIAMSKQLPVNVRSEAYRMRGLCHYRQNEDQAAAYDLEKAYGLDPRNYLAHHWLGIVYFAHMKLYGQAQKAFDASLKIHPNYVPSLLFRGVCSAYQYDLDNAFEDFSRAYDVDPQWVHQFIERGLESDYDAKRYEVDVAETRKFLAGLRAYVTLMSTQQKMGNYKHGLYMGLYSHYTRKYAEAVKFFNGALVDAPDTQKRRLYIFRGLSLDMLGKHTQAIADFTRALETKPNDVFGRLHRSTSYLRTGQLDKATADLNRVTREDPSQVRAALNLGMIATLRKRHDEARSWFVKALEISPSDTRCLSLMAWFRCQNPSPYRDLSVAERLARRALRENRSVALSWGMLGVVFDAQGKRQAAIEHYRHAIKAKPAHWYFTRQYYQKLLGR